MVRPRLLVVRLKLSFPDASKVKLFLMPLRSVLQLHVFEVQDAGVNYVSLVSDACKSLLSS